MVLDSWASTGFIPAFLQGGATTDPIDVGASAFDIDILAPDVNDIYMHLCLRVRDTDGAMGVVSYVPVDPPSPQPLPGGPECGGPYHTAGLCCHVSYVNCAIVKQVLKRIVGANAATSWCGSCPTCYANCLACVNNPCHACDPCGLILFLCQNFGIGNC